MRSLTLAHNLAFKATIATHRWLCLLHLPSHQLLSIANCLSLQTKSSYKMDNVAMFEAWDAICYV